MNKRQVITLWVIALALGGAVVAVKLSQNKATKVSTERKAGDTLFASFPGSETASVELQGANGKVSLVKKDGKWTVSERAGYPANGTYVNDLIRTLGELKVKQAMEAGPSFAPRFGMDESSSKAADRGITASFKDASGEDIAKVGFGKSIESAAAPSPMMGMGGNSVGRYIRNYADESGFYAVSEMFPAVTTDPKRWLSDAFINPEKIKTITVNKPGKTETDWTVTRDSEEAEFKLEGATAPDVLDGTIGTSLKGLFSYARFEDVVPADQIATKGAANDKRDVTIETVEGFTYKVTVTPTVHTDPEPTQVVDPEAEPTALDNYLVTVDVTAEIPEERKKEENEKPEDATAKDAAFTERQKALTEKLAKEKAFSGITFEVSKSLVENLIKPRREMIAKPAAPAEGAAPEGAGNVQQLPGGLIATPPVRANRPAPHTRPPATATTPPVEVTTPPIEATTPPISVPPTDEKAAPEEKKGE